MALSISGSSPSFSSYQGGTITSGTAQATTSGTSIDFTSIPSWVKRVTVLFNNVSTSGSNVYIIQIGSGSFTTTGYASTATVTGAGTAAINVTNGFAIWHGAANESQSGLFTICLVSGTTYVGSGVLGYSSAQNYTAQGGGVSPALSGALDRVRITTNGGTDTFDLGSINILYE